MFSLKYFSQYSHLAPFLACAINVLHNMVFKTKIKQLKTAVSFWNIAANISCEDGTEMMSEITKE